MLVHMDIIYICSYIAKDLTICDTYLTDARDLLSLMLHQNPTERPTLEKLFLHPWIVKGDSAQCCEQRRVDKLTGQTMSLSL